MNKKIKLSLLGTLIAGSALAVTLPIVSCSASSDVVLTPSTPDTAKATTAYTTYVATGTTAALQQDLVNVEHKIDSGTAGTAFTALLAAVTFTEKDDTTVTVAAADAIESFEVTTKVTVTAGSEIPAGLVLTVNLKSGYSTDNAITITLAALGTAKAK